MKEIYEFIKSCACYYIATIEGDKPHVRPFGTILLWEDKLYIQSGHKKDFAKQVLANPKVEICAFNGKGEWLRVQATLVCDPRVEAKKAMLDDYQELRAMYDENDDNTAVYYLKDGKATFCSFLNTSRTVEF